MTLPLPAEPHRPVHTDTRAQSTRCAILVTLTLAACGAPATTQSHLVSEPTDGERARIRVTGDNGMFVRAFPERTCVDYWAPNAGVVLGQIGRGIPGFKGRSLGMPNPPKDPRTAAEFYVEAGKPVTLSFWKRDREGECDVSLTFTPQADKDYEGSMTVLYSIKASKKICVPVVLSLSDPGERVPHTIAGECTRPGARTVGDQSAGAPASGTEPARSP